MFTGLTKLLPTSQSLGRFRFSTSSIVSREWKTIEARRIAHPELPLVGEKIPQGFYIPKEKPEYPEYKYGESRIYKKSNKGLYGGRFIQFGNQISEKSKHKTRRTWKVNTQKKKFWSEALNKNIHITVATKVLRTITREGGIDNYLTKEKSARIKELGPTGWKLRFQIMVNQAKLANPSKNYIELAEDSNGKKVPVYANVNDTKVTVGKRKLLSILYGLQLESNTELTFKEFMFKYRDESFEEVLNLLQKYNYDISHVTL